MFNRYLLMFITALFLHQETQGMLDSQWYQWSSVLSPVTEATKHLQTTLDEIAVKKQQLEIQKKHLKDKIEKIPEQCRTEDLLNKFAMFDKWNFDSCVNLTDDMKTGSELVVRGYSYVRNTTHQVAALLAGILDCPNKDFSNISSCFNGNLKALKAQIEAFRNETVPIVHDSTVVSAATRHDLDHCIGIPETSKDQIEKEIENIKC